MRNKNRANLNQAFSCLNRVQELMKQRNLPLEKEEWFTLVAVATYAGEINALHHKLSKQRKEEVASYLG